VSEPQLRETSVFRPSLTSVATQANIDYWPSVPSAHNLLVIDDLYRSSGYIDFWLRGGIDTDNDGLLNVEEEYWYHTDPYDSDTDNDNLSDFDEVNIYSTNPLAWSTDGDILSDSQEIAWGYDPNNTYDPINAQELTYSAWQVNGVTGYVRANHYSAMDYVKVYVSYKYSTGQWTSYFYVGTDYTPTYYGDYYVSWELLLGFVQMQVNVKAYDASGHYLGSDQQYVTLPGGGGKPGDPLPE
jgi:hypothetical protein